MNFLKVQIKYLDPNHEWSKIGNMKVPVWDQVLAYMPAEELMKLQSAVAQRDDIEIDVLSLSIMDAETVLREVAKRVTGEKRKSLRQHVS
jgi:hypothetical protein